MDTKTLSPQYAGFNKELKVIFHLAGCEENAEAMGTTSNTDSP